MTRTTSEVRALWGDPCEPELQTLTLWSGARASVDERAAEAFRAVDVVMQGFAYAPRPADTGGYNCRAASGGGGASLHSFGLAVDYSWNSNPYRPDRDDDDPVITDMPAAMVNDILVIHTEGGIPVFRWGGDWHDAMHYEVNASPAELADGVDWETVKATKPDPTKPSTWPVLELGDTGPTVRELQARLAGAGHPVAVDGTFGNTTADAVEDYQQSRQLEVDGAVGLQTWTALLHAQPPTKPENSPIKRPPRNVRGRAIIVLRDSPEHQLLTAYPDLFGDDWRIVAIASRRRRIRAGNQPIALGIDVPGATVYRGADRYRTLKKALKGEGVI